MQYHLGGREVSGEEFHAVARRLGVSPIALLGEVGETPEAYRDRIGRRVLLDRIAHPPA